MSTLRRLVFAFLIACIAVVPTLSVTGSAQGTSTPFVENVDITFRAPNLTRVCGFKVYVNVVGTVTFHANGGGIELTRYRLDHVFMGPGGSMTVDRTENEKITWTTNADGQRVETITYTGTMMYHTIIPGYGSIGNNSGREVFEVTLEKNQKGKWVVVDYAMIADSGPNNTLNAEDYAIICDYLN